MIQGLITSKDVLLRGVVIVREFGFVTWFRCCLVLLSGRHTHFPRAGLRQVTERATPLPALRTAHVGPPRANAIRQIGRSRKQGEPK